MPLFKMIVFLDPVEGREEEFNHWYDTKHVPDILSIDCYQTAQRFRTGPRYMDRDAPCAYAAIYEMEADSLDAALEAGASGAARFTFSDAVDLATTHAYPLTPMGPVFQSSEDARAHAGT